MLTLYLTRYGEPIGILNNVYKHGEILNLRKKGFETPFHLAND
ncbi:hypothetical protein J6TS2_51850 [Heyndrickxia sporothermodurans]|nr:hypothetical protein J6TS2_51850 [Heyndrickxia sporothermodurans]